MENFKATMEKSAMVESLKINEDLVKTLSESPVTQMHDSPVCDTIYLYIFIRHADKISRFAIYNPEQSKEEEGTKTPVVFVMKSLLQSVGGLSP